MSTFITINNITGSSPFEIYLCDNPITVCNYIDTVTTLPYTFEVPSSMSALTTFNLQVIDNTGCEDITFLDSQNPLNCPEYLGYDLVNNCYGVSVDFFVKLPEVLFGGSPCLGGPPSGGGISPSGNCPAATVGYSINGGPQSSLVTYCFGATECGYSLSGCNCMTHHIESGLDLTSYAGQSVTINYEVTYPSSPSLTFTETITITIPVCS